MDNEKRIADLEGEAKLANHRIEELEKGEMARDKSISDLKAEAAENTAMRKQLGRAIKWFWGTIISVFSAFGFWLLEHFVLGK